MRWLLAVQRLAAAGGEWLVLATDEAGVSCLHGAVSFGHLTVVRYLLTLPCAPALLDIVNGSGHTALHLARLVGREAVIEAILVGGAAALRSARAARGR